MKKVFLALAITLSLSLSASAAEKSAREMVDAILGTMNKDEILKDSRGGMPTEYEYSFIDECHFNVHSEWYGQTHGIIDDEIIPLGEVKIEKLQEEGKYYLFFQCFKGGKCISVKGENTGDPHDYMFIQSIVPAGSSLKIFTQLKSYFEKLSSLCAVDTEDNHVSSIPYDEFRL